MNKIVGFSIQRDADDLELVDFFSAGFRELREVRGRWHLRLWAIGEPAACAVGGDGAYSLGFPPSEERLTRNVLIRPLPDGFRIENDWLGSIPVFYNVVSGRVSTLMGRVRGDAEVDPVGAREFFSFGFSVFSRTAFGNVHFMPAYSAVTLTADGRVVVEQEADPVTTELSRPASTPGEVISAMESSLRRVPGTVIVPTSGGFDSRFLNALFPEPERIRAFTYGTSAQQERSFEVRYAREVCARLGVRWEQIEQKQYFNEIPAWHRIYDCSTHLHGMYHIDFYRTIRERMKGETATLLSGIYGDAWSGNVRLPQIKTAAELEEIAYLHRVRVDPASLLPETAEERETFFIANQELLNHPAAGPVVMGRLKIILISYIVTLPEYFGWPAWSPFLDLRVAGAMIRRPEELREKRRWQQDFFRSRNLMVEESVPAGDRSHLLELTLSRKFQFEPLREEFFTGLIEPEYVRKINRELSRHHRFDPLIARLQATPKVWRLLEYFQIAPRRESALNAYYVLKAFELSRREQLRRS